MTKDEALKLALEALLHVYHEDEAHPKTLQAIAAIKEVLANVATNDTPKERVDEIQKQRHEANVQKFLGAPQPEQEPVAWLHRQGNFTEASMNPLHDDEIDRGWTQELLYTTPPQRTWVGLTDEEFNELDKEDLSLRQFVQAIDDRLKQKNGYAEEKNT